MGLWLKIAVGVFCIAIALAGSLWVVRERLPKVFTLRNELDDAACAVTFDDGTIWNVSIRRGEEKYRVFLRLPELATARCRAGAEAIEVIASEFGCGLGISNLNVRAPKDPESRAFC